MLGQNASKVANGFDNPIREPVASKVFGHLVDDFLPTLLTTFLEYSFVTDHGKLLRAWDEVNQNAVSCPRFLHSQPHKFVLSSIDRIFFQFSTMNKNSNFSRGS